MRDFLLFILYITIFWFTCSACFLAGMIIGDRNARKNVAIEYIKCDAPAYNNYFE